jgi:hypothetical protein
MTEATQLLIEHLEDLALVYGPSPSYEARIHALTADTPLSGYQASAQGRYAGRMDCALHISP